MILTPPRHHAVGGEIFVTIHNMTMVIKNSSEFKNQKELIQKLIDLDSKIFGELSRDDTGDVDYWYNIDTSSFCHVALNEKDVIVGYIDAQKISAFGIEQLKKGVVREGHMESIIDKSTNKNINVYICSIAILPEYQKHGLGRKLFNENLKYALSQGFAIQNFYATIWSTEGEIFFSKYKPSCIAYDMLGHPVICFPFSPDTSHTDTLSV